MDLGTVIADRFDVERRAGAGAMGTVYRARDRRSDKLVALKLMDPTGPASADRFVREAEILSGLSHPGIVRYVAHGRLADGQLFLAMEWLEGKDLAALLEERGLSLGEGLALAARAAAALGAAHARGVVHRDVKPGNLFLVGGAIDQVRLIDFGIARLSTYSRVTTRTGVVIGTPGYLAPEQARGEREVDAAADVFSLGCVLFEVLTGRRPFAGDHLVAVLAKILVDPAPRLADVQPDAPPELDDLLARMLDKDPARRPRDGAMVAAELAAIEAREGSGARLAAKSPARAALTAREQSLVSVVLAAPAALTGEAASDTPTVAIDDITAARTRLATLAARFGGRLLQLADGSSLAMLSGAESAAGQAARAARCALALQEALPGAAVVLATGLGVVAERLPVGEAIDRAARMLAEAARAPGRVRVDDLTAELLEPLFQVIGQPGSREIHGEREGEEPVRTLLGRPSPYVGRERDLAMLEELFEGCVAEPAAAAALVTAPAGGGKTRLRQELCKRIGDRAAIWIGAGDPLGTGSPFGLLGRAARRALGVRSGDAPAAQEAALHAAIARRLGGEEAARAAEFLGELFEVPLAAEPSVQLRAARQDSVLMGDRMRWAFELLLRAESAERPLILVLEDLHWGDLATVKLVDAALRDLADCPLLVLALARPEIDERFPSLWRDRGALRLNLGPLGKKASERLLREHLGGRLSTAEIARLIDRAEGNALYLEELIRVAAESRDDREAELPASVLAMLEVRLARLDPEARRLLRAASIFGAVFREAGVRALLGGADRTEVVRDLLRDLVEREVLVAAGSSAGEPAFAFRHALVRDAAYTTLTEADRRLGHRLAAAHLEQSGERDAGLLGEHFERGGERGRAAERYLRAAEHALAGDDLEAALGWGARAAACGAAGEELGAVRRVEAEAHAFRGANAEAARAGEAALDLLRRGSAAYFQAAADVATAKSRLGELAALAALGDDLAATSHEPGARGPLLVALARTAILLLHQGAEDRVARLMERVTEIAATGGAIEPTARGWLDRARAVMALHAGDPARYLDLTAAAAASFEAAGDQRTASVQRGNVGYAYLELGAFADAERELRAAHAISKALGAHHNVMLIQHNLGLALSRPYEHGDPPARPRGEALAEAAALESEAMAAFSAQGHPRLVGYSRLYLARIRATAGDLDEAARLAREAAEILAALPPGRATALATLALITAARGEGAEALAVAAEAMKVLASLRGIEEGESLIRLAWAEALHAAGERDRARAAIAEAHHRLLARAALISRPALAETFLRRIPENARTLALAAAWSVSDPPSSRR